MPIVNGKRYSYTSEGMAKARQAIARSPSIDYRRDGRGVRKFVGGKPTKDVRGAEDDFPRVSKRLLPKRGRMSEGGMLK